MPGFRRTRQLSKPSLKESPARFAHGGKRSHKFHNQILHQARFYIFYSWLWATTAANIMTPESSPIFDHTFLTHSHGSRSISVSGPVCVKRPSRLASSQTGSICCPLPTGFSSKSLRSFFKSPPLKASDWMTYVWTSLGRHTCIAVGGVQNSLNRMKCPLDLFVAVMCLKE